MGELGRTEGGGGGGGGTDPLALTTARGGVMREGKEGTGGGNEG